MDYINQFTLLDARKLSTYIKEPCVDVIITSPPYWDLKDYGADNQIGFGQSKDEYLADIEEILRSCLKILKPTGSMWLIADNYRKDGILHLLPWEIGGRAREAGWKIRDMIIWDKQYNVPWHQKGQLRNTSEFILFMTKTDDYNYFVDRIKELDEISKWWVSFPERFNPKGKTPTNIWSFPIRRRGTWPTPSKVDHYCSLPTGLVSRIIELTTNPGDLVADPFAGSGVVLAQAKVMGRHYSGCDINTEYIRMFTSSLEEVEAEWKKIQKWRENIELAEIDFEQTVMALRALKYTRQVTKPIFDALPNIHKDNIRAILCFVDLPNQYDREVPIDTSIWIITKSYTPFCDELLVKSIERSKKPPLTHYGIKSSVRLVTYMDFLASFNKYNLNVELYLYPFSNTRRYVAKGTLENWFKESALDQFTTDSIIPLLANIAVDVAWVVE